MIAIAAILDSGGLSQNALANTWGLTHDGQYQSTGRWYLNGAYLSDVSNQTQFNAAFLSAAEAWGVAGNTGRYVSVNGTDQNVFCANGGLASGIVSNELSGDSLYYEYSGGKFTGSSLENTTYWGPGSPFNYWSMVSNDSENVLFDYSPETGAPTGQKLSGFYPPGSILNLYTGANTFYFVNGVMASLNPDGSGYWSRAHIDSGGWHEYANGIDQGLLNGFYNDFGGGAGYFVGGHLKSFLDINGNGYQEENGKFYLWQNAINTGPLNGFNDTDGSGINRLFDNGEPVNRQVVNGKYYIYGYETTLNISGNGYWSYSQKITNNTVDVNDIGPGWAYFENGLALYNLDSWVPNFPYQPSGYNSDDHRFINAEGWFTAAEYDFSGFSGNGWYANSPFAGYYINRVLTSLDENGNGWWQAQDQPAYFYLAGEATNLNQSGTGWYDKGDYNPGYYFLGYRTTLNIVGTGWWAPDPDPNLFTGYYITATKMPYPNAVGEQGLNELGNGYIEDPMTAIQSTYVEGEPQTFSTFNGEGYYHFLPYRGYYIGDQLTTLDRDGNGVWNDQNYSGGIPA